MRKSWLYTVSIPFNKNYVATYARTNACPFDPNPNFKLLQIIDIGCEIVESAPNPQMGGPNISRLFLSKSN